MHVMRDSDTAVIGCIPIPDTVLQVRETLRDVVCYGNATMLTLAITELYEDGADVDLLDPNGKIQRVRFSEHGYFRAHPWVPCKS